MHCGAQATWRGSTHPAGCRNSQPHRSSVWHHCHLIPGCCSVPRCCRQRLVIQLPRRGGTFNQVGRTRSTVVSLGRANRRALSGLPPGGKLGKVQGSCSRWGGSEPEGGALQHHLLGTTGKCREAKSLSARSKLD